MSMVAYGIREDEEHERLFAWLRTTTRGGDGEDVGITKWRHHKGDASMSRPRLLTSERHLRIKGGKLRD